MAGGAYQQSLVPANATAAKVGDPETTISGSTAFHAGNDGIGSGLDADSLEGNEPGDIGASESEIQDAALVFSEGVAPNFGGK